MKILYLHEFIEELERLDKKAQRQIKEKLKDLYRTPAEGHVPAPLKGTQFKGLYKLRVVDRRLIYKLEQGGVFFITLGRRSEVCKP